MKEFNEAYVFIFVIGGQEMFFFVFVFQNSNQTVQLEYRILCETSFYYKQTSRTHRLIKAQGEQIEKTPAEFQILL